MSKKAEKTSASLDRAEFDRLAASGMGLGDIVSKMTKALGLKECAGCTKRRAALNKLRLPDLLKRKPKEAR